MQTCSGICIHAFTKALPWTPLGDLKHPPDPQLQSLLALLRTGALMYYPQVGKLKSSFSNFKTGNLPELFLEPDNLDTSISTSFSSFLNSLIISAVRCK